MAIKKVVTARIKAITTRVAIRHLKETNQEASAAVDQTPEVEQETTITTITNSSLAKMINNITGRCPSRSNKREEGGKNTKEVLLQAKCKRKIAKTRRKRRLKFRRSQRFNPNTRRSRHCRV